MIRGLVLDVDDTLYLERDYVRSGFEALDGWAEQTFGVFGLSARAWSLFTAGERGTTITDALAQLGVSVTGDIRREAVARYRQHAPTISPLPDTTALLRNVGPNLQMGIVTDGPSDSQHAKCEALRVTDWASPVVITADLGRSKPDPGVFAPIAAQWHLRPGQLAYVGDNPAKDFQGPVELGWSAFRIRRHGSLHENVPTPPGVLEISSLDDPLLLARLAM